MKIAILNGTNLNLLGSRDKAVYGSRTLRDIIEMVRAELPEIEIEDYQSNHEGAMIDYIQSVGQDDTIKALVINPGAFAHYSYAIADALRDLRPRKPIVEVHLSNIHAREEFRQHSVTAACVDAVIAGAGARSYLLGALHAIYLANQ